jgi:hypothetical protein
MDEEQKKLTAKKFVSEYPRFFRKDWSWFESNWHIVEAFEAAALHLIRIGREHYSARTIVEVLVHESILKETDGEFKIGNDHAPDLARIFVALHPEHLDFWEYRRPDHPDFKNVIREFSPEPAALLA